MQSSHDMRERRRVGGGQEQTGEGPGRWRNGASSTRRRKSWWGWGTMASFSGHMIHETTQGHYRAIGPRWCSDRLDLDGPPDCDSRPGFSLNSRLKCPGRSQATIHFLGISRVPGSL